jgi:UTP--glucose-1-phosphate uridylyltransferase
MPQAVRTAVLPVAGFGTRFLPVTKAVPKELLPIVDRPCIEYAVVEAVEAGIERVVMVTTHGKEALADYFDANPELERHLEEQGKDELLRQVRSITGLVDVVTVRQRDARGLGLAVLSARAAVGEEPFAVLLADDVIDAPRPVIGQLMEGCLEGQAAVALMEVPPAQTARYGVCGGAFRAPGRMDVRQMIEKPEPDKAPSNMAIIGRYILPADIFDILEATPAGKNGEVQLTDALAVLAGQGRVTGVVFEGRRFDAGSVPGWLQANLHFAARRPELARELKALLGGA